MDQDCCTSYSKAQMITKKVELTERRLEKVWMICVQLVLESRSCTLVVLLLIESETERLFTTVEFLCGFESNKEEVKRHRYNHNLFRRICSTKKGWFNGPTT